MSFCKKYRIMYRINICKRRSCVISLHPPTSSNCHSAILCKPSCCSPLAHVSCPSRCLRPCFAVLSAIDSFIIPVPIRRIVYGQNHSLNIPVQAPHSQTCPLRHLYMCNPSVVRVNLPEYLILIPFTYI